eukprot:Skav215000  [mRNA]  locus=scaffold508:959762:970723:- [translate_table: standard]
MDSQWLQVRHRLEEIVRGAQLKTAAEEEALLANLRQQMEQLIKQKQVDTDVQKAAKAVRTGAGQSKLGRHAAQGEDVVLESAGEPAAPAKLPKPSWFMRKNWVKQSGLPNVRWNNTALAWHVSFPKLDSKGQKIGRMGRIFAVKKFLIPGRSKEEADAAALEAAKAFRAQLVLQGILSEPSKVPGVFQAISKVVVEAQSNGIIASPAPIVGRIHQEMGLGMTKLQNAMRLGAACRGPDGWWRATAKLASVDFPAPYNLAIKARCDGEIRRIHVFCMFGLNQLAAELDNPFCDSGFGFDKASVGMDPAGGDLHQLHGDLKALGDALPSHRRIFS